MSKHFNALRSTRVIGQNVLNKNRFKKSVFPKSGGQTSDEDSSETDDNTTATTSSNNSIGLRNGINNRLGGTNSSSFAGSINTLINGNQTSSSSLPLTDSHTLTEPRSPDIVERSPTMTDSSRPPLKKQGSAYINPNLARPSGRPEIKLKTVEKQSGIKSIGTRSKRNITPTRIVKNLRPTTSIITVPPEDHSDEDEKSQNSPVQNNTLDEPSNIKPIRTIQNISPAKKTSSKSSKVVRINTPTETVSNINTNNIQSTIELDADPQVTGNSPSTNNLNNVGQTSVGQTGMNHTNVGQTIIVRGPKGPQGEAGIPGQPGDDGERGLRGYQGSRGEKGAQGYPGEKGEKGDKGDKGDKGEKGEAGKVSIVPCSQCGNSNPSESATSSNNGILAALSTSNSINNSINNATGSLSAMDCFGYYYLSPGPSSTLEVSVGRAIPFQCEVARNQKINNVNHTDIQVHTIGGQIGIFEISFTVVPRDPSQFGIQIGSQVTVPISQCFGSSSTGQVFVPVSGHVMKEIPSGSLIRLVLLTTSGSSNQSTTFSGNIGGTANAVCASMIIKQIARGSAVFQ